MSSTLEGVAEPLRLGSGEAQILCAPQDTAPSTWPHRVHLYAACSSSLDAARLLAARGELEVWDSILCARQWAGRGQLRRHWVSEPGNLFAAWRLPMPSRQWQNLTSVLVGWALCQSFARLGIALQLKWPNDLLHQGRKVGGILLEEHGDILVAGIGINLASCPDEALMRAQAACPAASLRSVLPDLSVAGLWLLLVGQGQFWYQHTLSASAPMSFVQLIEPVMSYFGQLVVISDNRSSFCGVFTGLSSDGGIVLRSEEAEKVFHSGSLAPAADGCTQT